MTIRLMKVPASGEPTIEEVDVVPTVTVASVLAAAGVDYSSMKAKLTIGDEPVEFDTPVTDGTTVIMTEKPVSS